jgi:hypothetical protein
MTAVTKTEKEKFWQTQMEQYGEYSGTRAAFCRERGLSFFQFRYWATRFDKSKSKSRLIASPSPSPSPFVRVAVGEPTRSENHSPLPDAKWLAEFIVQLHRATAAAR